MPYKIVKTRGANLYYVVSDSGRRMSKDPMPYESALRQMRALYAAMSRRNET